MKKALIVSFALALALGIMPMAAFASACVPTECTTNITEVVSDNTNTVQETSGNAVNVTFIHPAWTANIPGATWIWAVDPVANPTTDEYSTFEKQFNVAGSVTSAVLDIASDNSYEVWINNILVGGDASENNFSSGGQDQYTATVVSALQTGTNTIKVKVKNWALGGSTPTTNPAGLLYKLVVTSQICPPLCCGDVKIKNKNIARVSSNVTVTANSGGNSIVTVGGSTCQEHSISIVSDTTNTVVGDGNAIAVIPHAAWTASIPDATWIWKSSATAPNEVVIFEKNFTVVGSVLSAQLNIATDNSYKVFIDNVEVAADVADNNFQVATQDVYDLTANVTSGNHTLRIEVKNVGTYNSSSNPAGLLYKLVVNSKECSSGGGNSGSIITGYAWPSSSVVNVVNTNTTRIRR